MQIKKADLDLQRPSPTADRLYFSVRDLPGVHAIFVVRWMGELSYGVTFRGSTTWPHVALGTKLSPAAKKAVFALAVQLGI